MGGRVYSCNIKEICMLNRTFAVLILLVTLVVFFPVSVVALTGGPDRGGYTFYDSQETGVDKFSWDDISKEGTLIGKDVWNNATLVPVLVPIGFDFTFYGETYSHVYVSEYGYVTFDDYQLGSFKLEDIPTPKHRGGAADNFIAGVWGDLFPGT